MEQFHLVAVTLQLRLLILQETLQSKKLEQLRLLHQLRKHQPRMLQQLLIL